MAETDQVPEPVTPAPNSLNIWSQTFTTRVTATQMMEEMSSCTVLGSKQSTLFVLQFSVVSIIWWRCYFIDRIFPHASALLHIVYQFNTKHTDLARTRAPHEDQSAQH